MDEQVKSQHFGQGAALHIHVLMVVAGVGTLACRAPLKPIDFAEAGVSWAEIPTERQSQDSGGTKTDVLEQVWTLPALIERAVAVAPSLEQTQASLDRAEASLRMAESAFGLNLNFGLSATYSDNPGRAFLGELNAGELDLNSGLGDTPWTAHSQAGLHAGYLLWDGGGRAARVSAAGHGLEASRLEIRARSLQVEATAAGLYLGLRESTALARATEVRLNSVDAAIDAERARLEAGAGMASSVSSLLARRASIEEALLFAESLGSEQKNSLAILVGAKPGRHLEVDLEASVGAWADDGQAFEESLLSYQEETQLDELLGMALRMRPDVASAFAVVAAGEQGLNAAERSFGPTISAFADAWLDGGTPLIAADRGSASVGAALNWNLTDGGLRDAREATARADLRSARAALGALVETVELEVVRARRAVRLAKQRQQSVMFGLENAESALSELAAGFEAGTVNLERWLGAEATAAEARARVLKARAQETAARARMELILGNSLLGPVDKKVRSL